MGTNGVLLTLWLKGLAQSQGWCTIQLKVWVYRGGVFHMSICMRAVFSVHPVQPYTAVYVLYTITALSGTETALCMPAVDPWAALLNKPTITVPRADLQSFLKMMGLLNFPPHRAAWVMPAFLCSVGSMSGWAGVGGVLQERTLGQAIGAEMGKVT